MEKMYFVAGIDTDVGKTVASALMARSLMSRQIDAITLKLVQTGCTNRSEDIETHRRLCWNRRFYEDELGLTSPQIFKYPSSPELSARLEGKTVDLQRIDNCIEYVTNHHALTLVECAGGLCVPLTEDLLTIDFIAARKRPVVLVTSTRLGSINHTILSLEALKARQIPLAGVVCNLHPAVDEVMKDDTIATIRRRLARLGFPERLVTIPSFDLNGAIPDLDFTEIFQ